MNKREFLSLSCSALLASAFTSRAEDTSIVQTDVCVYGGTASGVAAAIAAADEGASVVLVEPSRWLGGVSGGGTTAPTLDWGHKDSVGGLALKLLLDGDDVGMRALYKAELAKRNITVIFEHRLSKVTKESGSISAITLDYAPPDALGVPAPEAKETGTHVISARAFVDCSYEGDLIAKSGVSYTYGREASETYGESLGGMLPMILTYPIDPYIKPGDRNSGLIPLVKEFQPGPTGSSDKLTQLYCFRLKLSKDADRIPIEKPDDYDPREFEVFRRGFVLKADMARGMMRRRLSERIVERVGLGPFHENASRSLWSHAAAGANTDYPEGDWKTRSLIWKFHIDFIRGMYHFLRTDPIVPKEFRDKANSIGLRPGIYDTGGWPNQLYIREARRMKSAYIITQKDVEGSITHDDSVGLASYGVDDWPYAMIPHERGIGIITGEFMNCRLNAETRGIYQIPYRSIVPLEKECSNLLVPVCCSASHVAMCSLRMEPVYVILGQSAGVAAALAAKQSRPVQKIEYAHLRERLLAGKQKLSTTNLSK